MDLNKDNLKKIRGLVIFTIVAFVIGMNYKSVFAMTGNVMRMIAPFLIGSAIAFILNVPMRRIEKLMPLKKGSKLRRPLSVVVTILFVFGIVVVVVFVVTPELIRTLKSLQESVPSFFAGVQKSIEDLYANNKDFEFLVQNVRIDWKQMLEGVIGFLSVGAGTMLTSTLSAAASIVSGITTFGIAFIFAIYILLQKEILGSQFRRFFHAFLPDKMSTAIIGIAGLTEKTFSNFLTGQCVEAVILGTMFFLILSLFQLPYALLIGVLIAFTALIPLFGAFIGCAIGIFLMLMISPADALVFTIIFFVLQQLEGNLIYPHVVGNSVGLPSIWVLVAVTLGGSAMGIVGMLIFIPLCSVIYTLLREVVHIRLDKKTRAVPVEDVIPVERGVPKERAVPREKVISKEKPGGKEKIVSKAKNPGKENNGK